VTARYLLDRTGRTDEVGAARLAQRLGGLPLAAEQAAVFLRTRQGISFDDYAADIARLVKRKKDDGTAGSYPDTVYEVLAQSGSANGSFWSRIRRWLPWMRKPRSQSGCTALDLVRLCAFLSPDGVDLVLLLTD
jgi:hypothetical protein